MFTVQERVLWIFENVQLQTDNVQVVLTQVLFSTDNALFLSANVQMLFSSVLVRKAQNPVTPERVQVLSA